MLTDFHLSPVKLISTKRRIEVRCAKGYEYVPHEDMVKEQDQFYEDYVQSLHLHFGQDSQVLRDFQTLYKDCKEQRIRIQQFQNKVQVMFKDHAQLILKFTDTVLPYLYPLATEEEVDRANQFFESVKAAFPDKRKVCLGVKLRILKFQAGKLTLKEMTVQMLELLENRVDLVKAYSQFVPQAQIVTNSTRFFAYPVMAGILTVFARGFSFAYPVIAGILAVARGLCKNREETIPEGSIPRRTRVSENREETMASQTMEACTMEIKFIPLKSRVDFFCRAGDYKYVPMKEAIKFYKAFVRSVQCEYGERSKEVNYIIIWYRYCKEHRITVDKFRSRIMWLFKSQPKLVIMFFETVVPYLFPLATEDEADRANQFIQRVKAAFPNNRAIQASVCVSVMWFQEGNSTLEQMTREVLQVLGNRNDLIDAYMDFVPQAQNFRSKGRSVSNPVIAGLLVGLVASAIGLSMMKK